MYTTTKSTFNVVFIELVALLHSAKASILPDSPRSVGVHGGIGPPSVRKHSWQFICPASWVCLGVHRLYVDSLRRAPDQIFRVLPLQLFLSQARPFRKQLSLVLTWYGSVDQTAVCVCWRDRSSNQMPGSHRCTCPLCSQHALQLSQSDAHGITWGRQKGTYVKRWKYFWWLVMPAHMDFILMHPFSSSMESYNVTNHLKKLAC